MSATCILRKPLHLDAFRHNPTGYKSWFGVVATLVTLGVMLFYIIYTLGRYVNGLPEVAYSHSPSQFRATNFSTLKAGIFIQSGLDFTNFLTNSSFGSVRVSQKTKVDKITNNSATVWTNAYNCNFTNFYSGKVTFPATHTLCFNLTGLAINGTYEDEIYQYIKIELLTCDPNTTTSCASSAEIRQHVEGANVNVLVEETQTNPDGQRITTITAPHWRMFPGQVLGSDIFLQRYTVSQSLRVIGTESARQSSAITLTFDHTEDFPRPALANDQAFAEIYFRLSRSETEETRTFGSFLDVLASWGALMGFISFILGVPIQKLNEFLFRLQLPLDKKDDLHTFLYTDFDEYGRLPTGNVEAAQARMTRSQSIAASLVTQRKSSAAPEVPAEVGALNL